MRGTESRPVNSISAPRVAPRALDMISFSHHVRRISAELVVHLLLELEERGGWRPAVCDRRTFGPRSSLAPVART